MKLLLFLLLLFPFRESFVSVDGYNLIFEQKMDSDEVEKLKDEIELFSSRLEKYFNGAKKVKTDIFIKSELPAGRFPEWGMGFFVPATNSIYLKMHAYHNRDEFYRVLKHEMVHAELYGIFGKKRFRPLWIEEGLCDFLSGKRIGFSESQKLSMALRSRKILPLDSLLVLPESKDRYSLDLFYIQSLLIVQLLEKKGYLREFIDWAYRENARKSPPHFRDKIDFEIWWQTELEERYKWFVLLNFEMLMAILIVIVFIMAYISKILRKRKQMRDLQDLSE